MQKKISDVKIGDKILGTDGKWHKVIGKTEPHIPYIMYALELSNGIIKCSDTHQWNVFVNGKMYTTDALGIEDGLEELYKGCHVGTKDGPTIVGIKRIEPEVVQCLITDAPDNQFMIYTEEKTKKEELGNNKEE